MARQRVYVEPETVLLLIETWNTTHSLAKCVRETGITRSAAITQLRDSGTITHEECLRLRGHLKSNDKEVIQTSTKEEESKKSPKKTKKAVSEVDINTKTRTRKSTETNTQKQDIIKQGTEPKRRGRPKGSKNKTKEQEVEVKKVGRPKGSKNKPKDTTVEKEIQQVESKQVNSKYKRTRKKSSDIIQIDEKQKSVAPKETKVVDLKTEREVKPVKVTESKARQEVKPAKVTDLKTRQEVKPAKVTDLKTRQGYKPNKTVETTTVKKMSKADIQAKKKETVSIFREKDAYKGKEQTKKDTDKKVTEFNPNKSSFTVKTDTKIEKGGVTIDLKSIKKVRKPRQSKEDIRDKIDYLDNKYGKGNWHIMSRDEAVERLMDMAESEGLITETTEVLEG